MATATDLIHLGYEVASGDAVGIPLRHMAVTGQTQESGKTTTLEALVSRAPGLRAVAFITKRGEGAFGIALTGEQQRWKIQPYFRERADWQFVAAVLEATLRERLKFERSWIMRACKGAHTLADVHRNVKEAMLKAKGLSADVYLTLDEYLKIVIPQLERLPYSKELVLHPGLNVMDLSGYSSELQALVIRSVLEWVYEREKQTVVIIPEAWEFLPQKRGGPVKLAAEEYIRKGAGLGDYLWLDSQDLAAVDVAIRKSIIIWLLGVQREENEVRRVLAHIPNAPKPKVDDVMQLGKGQFFVCWGKEVKRVYVQPAWMDEEDAIAISRGTVGVDAAVTMYRMGEIIHELGDDALSAEERAKLEGQITFERDRADRAGKEVDRLGEEVRRLMGQVRDREAGALAASELRTALTKLLGVRSSDGVSPAVDEEAIVNKVLARMYDSSQAAIVEIVAPKAILNDFQKQEVARILAFVGSVPQRPRDAFKLLEAAGKPIPQKQLADRLGIPTAGGSWIDFGKGIKSLVDEGYIESIERHGLAGVLRKKLAEDLAVYQPNEDQVDMVYAQVIYALATGEGKSGNPDPWEGEQ